MTGALSDPFGGPLPGSNRSSTKVTRSSDCKLGLANADPPLSPPDISLSDAQSAGLCKWLGAALVAQRQAVSLELERSHQQLLADCAKRWDPSCDGCAAVMQPSRMHSSSEKPSMGSHRSPGQAMDMKKNFDSISDGYGDDHQSNFRQSVEAFFESEDIEVIEEQIMSGQSSVFGTSQQGPKPERWAHRLVESNAFELTFALLICANTVAMAAEMQYVGIGLGEKLKYPSFVPSKQDVWPGAGTAFKVMDWFFGTVFTLELIFKIVGLRLTFLRDVWNYFDAVIVVTWLVDTLLRHAVELPVDPMLLRLARLARLLRLVKLLKSMNGVDHLFLMMTTIKGCSSILLWTGLILLTSQAFFAFLLNQMVVTFFLDIDGLDLEKQRETFKYFGTFTRSLLSMFEITLGNWVPVARNLYENVSPWFMLFSILHKLSMGFAVLGVVNGIFIQETFKVAACDDTIMLLQKERAIRVHGTKMHRFFQEADKSGDGMLDRYEFKSILCRPEVKTWLAAQELDASDADSLFTLLTNVMHNGEKKLSALELVQGAAKLKGAARSIDIAMLMRGQKEIRNIVREEIQNLSSDAEEQRFMDKFMDKFNNAETLRLETL